MAIRGGAPRRTYTWITAHAPWSAWAWRNTAFTAAAIPAALPVLLGLTCTVTAPGPGPGTIPPLLVLLLGPLLTRLQRSRFRALLGLEVPKVEREGGRLTPFGLSGRRRIAQGSIEPIAE
ncbi:hypothetical protein ACFWWM_29555 [Streptomyces sp. NPDC058682]|uniref:hypothetical protein n=1 Tax=Streptomyces sp. NPDC058682 TaxID=3346596 RepID=UPI0036623D08